MASPSYSSLVAHKLKRLDVSLVAAPSYLKQRGPVRTPEGLLEHRLLPTRAARGHATLSLIAKDSGEHVRLRVRGAISASDFSFSREAALAGAGIAVVPSVTVERDLEKKGSSRSSRATPSRARRTCTSSTRGRA